jgi:hypothetical protein
MVIHANICMYIYTPKYMYVHIYIYIRIHTYIRIHIYINTHKYIYIYIYICKYIYIYIYVCMYIHIYIHIHTYIHTCLYEDIQQSDIFFQPRIERTCELCATWMWIMRARWSNSLGYVCARSCMCKHPCLCVHRASYTCTPACGSRS